MTIGFALCGSFCTFEKAFPVKIGNAFLRAICTINFTKIRGSYENKWDA